MKTFRFLFTVVLSLLLHTALFAQNVSPQFSELKGMEDAQGNTHLLYRIHSSQHNSISSSYSNNIYNFIPGTLTDTIFLYDGYSCSIYMGWGSTVSAYDIWNDDLSKYIFAGELVNCFEPYFVISRFDSNFVYGDMFNDVRKIIISNQDDSLVFALPDLISTNGGFVWDTLRLDHQLVSVSPIDDRVFFSTDFTTSNISVIFKSTDSGNTFTLVDTGGNDWFPNFYYDIDGNHIYREHSTGYPNRSLKASGNQGNAFTWQNIYSTNNSFYLTLDESQSGAIYLADGKKIYRSTNYGNTFTLYKELDKRIIGICNKPNSNKLYAASKYRIYEITDDTTAVIKSLPIPEELLAFYPLSIGNYWIYKVTDWSYPYYSEDTYTKKVLSLETLGNNKEYFKIEEKYFGSSYTSYVYERVDSTNGLIYRFDNECANLDSEKVIDDLTSDLGDSLLIQRFTVCWDSILTYFSEDASENIFDENRNFRSFEYNWLMGYTHKLVQGIGIHSIRLGYDFGQTNFFLNGCVIDGIVYGDTTLTDVADENELPKEFSLSQNYPNPFNPITTIKYTIPNVISTEGRNLKATLKVFDILGKEIATLVNEEQPAGNYEVEFSATSVPVSSIRNLASGIYFYRLQVIYLESSSGQGFVETKKMVYLK